MRITGSINLFNLWSQTLERISFNSTESEITTIAISKFSKYLISGHKDQKVRIWHLYDTHLVASETIDTYSIVTSVKIDENNSLDQSNQNYFLFYLKI